MNRTVVISAFCRHSSISELFFRSGLSRCKGRSVNRHTIRHPRHGSTDEDDPKQSYHLGSSVSRGQSEMRENSGELAQVTSPKMQRSEPLDDYDSA
jgi:hypothetical protein